MRNIFNWTTAIVLLLLCACTKNEDFGDISLRMGPGVFGYVTPLVLDNGLDTKATVNPSNLRYGFEVGDRINIWSESGTLLIYSVEQVNENGRAIFTGGGFTLSEGKTYYSSHPLILSVKDDFKTLSTTFEGQIQTADNDANHVADYTYMYSSATCTNGNTSFQYHHICAYLMLRISLPGELTITDLSVTANDEIFAQKGTVDVTTGIFTPGEMSNTMSLKLDNVSVSDGVLNAFIAIAPCAAGDYVIRIKDSEGTVYSSPTLSQAEILTGKIRLIETAIFAGENPAVAKIGDVGYETLEAAFAAATDGQTITLLTDCAGNGIQAPQGKFNSTGVTVDFNGHTYTMDGAMVGSTGTQTQAFQLLKDNKITFKNGTIYSEKAKMLVQNYSDLTLDGMTLSLNNANYASAYTLSNNNGTVVIDGTTITANPAGGFAFDVCRYASYPSVDVTVKGASVINGDVEISASGNDAKDGFRLMLDAGTLNGDLVVDTSAAAAMASTPAKALIMENDSFGQAAPGGFKWESNGNGTSTLVACDYVAQVGDVKYETLEAAFAAATDGATITLLADCAGNGIQAPQGKFNSSGVTVDFNGHSYTMDGAMVGSTGTQTQAFQLLKDNKITFKNGTIYSEKAKMLVQNYSDLTLDGMTLSLNNANYASAYTLSNNNGTVVIDGTTITANPAGGFAFDVCRYASYPSVDVTVKGASVINGDVEISASGSDAKDGFRLMLEAGTLNGDLVVDASAAAAMASTPAKALIMENDAFGQAAPDGFKWVSNGDGTSTLVACNYVAQVGSTKYETLVEAVAATNSGTITLLKNAEGAGLFVADGDNKNITIDFNGNSYTVTGPAVGSSGTKSQALHLEKGNTIVIKGGTVSSTATSGVSMLVQNYCNLTVEDMVLDGTNLPGSNRYTLSNNCGTVVIDNSTINAKSGSFAFDVCRYSSYLSVNVTVKGNSAINGNIEFDAGSGDPKDGASLTLESAMITGNLRLTSGGTTALTSHADKAFIKKADAVTLAAPANFKWVANGDGTSTLKAVVALVGGVEYVSLEAAFAAATDGQTITLLTDCAGNGIQAPQGKFNSTGVTVDFNGHTYTMDGAMVGSTGTQTQAFQLLKDNKITFKNGTIYSEKAKMLVQNYSDLTLDGMTLSLNNANYASAYTLSNNNGTVVIDGTTITANPAGGFAFDVCRYASYPSVIVTVTGGSTIGGNIEVSASNNDPKDGFSLTLENGTINGGIVMASGAGKATITKNNTNFNVGAPTGYKWVDNGDGTSTLKEIVAQVGGVEYVSFEAAFGAATDGATITLLADCSGNGIKAPQGKFNSTGVTVDFNGHTYTMDGAMVGSTGTETQAFQLLKDNKITFKNGAIKSSKAYMLIQNYSDLTLQGMTLTLNTTGTNNLYTLSNNNGTVVIDGTTINAASTSNCFAFDVCRYASYPSVDVTVKGASVINGNIEFDAGNGNPLDGAKLTVEGGTINGILKPTVNGDSALRNYPAKAVVTKSNTVTLAAPTGFEWQNNGTTSTLVASL